MKIALLHPQCETQGGAIKMALLSADLLQKAAHDVVLYTFSYSPNCFTLLQKKIHIVHHDFAKKIIFSSVKKLINIMTLAWRIRHVDIVIANNPPMQIVAAFAKIFSLRIIMKEGRNEGMNGYKEIHHFSFFIFHFSLSTLSTIWWHHHTPWYKSSHFLKSFLERTFILPFIDTIVATSYFVKKQISEYCGREATVIYPILSVIPELFVPSSSGKGIHCVAGTNEDPGIQENKLPGNGSFNSSGLDSTSRPPTSDLAGMTESGGDDRCLLFTHGRLEPGKGLETIISIFERIKKDDKNIHLTLYGTGSLEKSLKSRGIDVQPYNPEMTLGQIASSNQSILAIYASTIDAFGIAPLEAQSTGISTLILDRGGARETLLSDMSGELVARLVDSEEDLYSTVSYFIAHKKFPKNMSIVNFSHTIEYFSPERLSSDLLSLISKKEQKNFSKSSL